MVKRTLPRRLICGISAVCLLLTLLCPVGAAETDYRPDPSLPDIPEETTSPTEPAYTFFSPYNLYFGLLHAHTNASDGSGTPEAAFARAAATENLDFFAVTDHSNSFDNADAGSLTVDGCTLSAEWAAGKAAAVSVTSDSFLGLYGFEMTWPEIRQLGHITTYGTPGWITRDQEGFADDPDALQNYLDALAAVPGSFSQFCHPGSFYGSFDSFRHYRTEYDDRVPLLEVLGDGSTAAYIQALDRGWHPAPTASRDSHSSHWGCDGNLRTVVLAEALTETSLFSAIRERRVYATEDRDLHLSFDLDGAPMGSILPEADNPEISVSYWDPTDTGGFTVDVISEGGARLASVTGMENGDLTIPVSGGFRWYFLKITQADGDTAVTAPVWVEDYSDLGISAFTADSHVPTRGRPLMLTLELYNNEHADLSLTSLSLYAEENLIHRETTPETVSAGQALSFSIPYTHTDVGTVSLRALVQGTLLGRELSWEAGLSLRFRPEETTAKLLIDGSHNNLGLDALTNLQTLAGDAGTETTLFTGPMPQGGQLLLIPPLQEMPEADFCADVAAFLETGGSLILLAGPEGDTFGNTLLESLGSGLRYSGTSIKEGASKAINRDSPWFDTISQGAMFLHGPGCALESESGSWLVKDASETHVLLACEKTAFGGMVFAAGTSFLPDGYMPGSYSIWDSPSANQTFFLSLLGSAQPPLEELCIHEVRSAPAGTICRIRGYVTAGTSNSNTRFPDTIYLQDDTGGIAVTGFSVPDIRIGTPMEIIGVLQEERGMPVLKYTDHRLPDEPYRTYLPDTISCQSAGDYSLYSGELVEITGTVTKVTLTSDGKGVSRIVIEDAFGDAAVIEIEDNIGSGASGKNTLAKKIKEDRTIRAKGFLHINDAGETVLRVRDCDEVVYIPPKPDPSNPQTADRHFGWLPR